MYSIYQELIYIICSCIYIEIHEKKKGTSQRGPKGSRMLKSLKCGYCRFQTKEIILANCSRRKATNMLGSQRTGHVRSPRIVICQKEGRKSLLNTKKKHITPTSYNTPSRTWLSPSSTFSYEKTVRFEFVLAKYH